MRLIQKSRAVLSIKKSGFYSSILLAVILSCCSRQEPDAFQVVEREGPDGVKEVLSIAAEPPPAPWILTEDLVIGVEYGDEDYMLRNPWTLTVLEDGTMVVLDSRPLQFRLYDSRGGFVTAFGREGDGPDDLRWGGPGISNSRTTGSDRFEFWTRWPTRIQTWNRQGHLVSVRTLPDNHPFLEGRRPRLFKPFGSDFLGLFSWGERLENESYKTIYCFVLTDWEGTRVDSVAVIECEPFQMPRGASMAQAVSDYTPTDQYLVTDSGRIYYSGMLEDWVRQLDPATGLEVLRFHWEHEPDAIPEALVERTREEMEEEIAEGMQWLRERVYMSYLVEGPEGEVWIQRTGDSNEEGIWVTDVFGRDGVFRGRMPLPFAPRKMKISGEYLYAIGTNGEAPAIIRYRMEPAG